MAIEPLGVSNEDDQTLLTADWLMFVSPNAVNHSMTLSSLRTLKSNWPERLRVGSTGPGTHQALVAAGVPASVIDSPAADAPQFDSEALWDQIKCRDWQQKKAVVVRGRNPDGQLGRPMMATQLRAAGAEVLDVAVYERRLPLWSPSQKNLCQQALDHPQRFIWLFSSSLAIDHLPALAGSQNWARSQALVTHPRMSPALERLGFVYIRNSRPERADVFEQLSSYIQFPHEPH